MGHTFTAARALVCAYDRLMPAAEFMAFADLRRKNQVQVCRVNITVSDDRPFSQNANDAVILVSPFRLCH